METETIIPDFPNEATGTVEWRLKDLAQKLKKIQKSRTESITVRDWSTKVDSLSKAIRQEKSGWWSIEKKKIGCIEVKSIEDKEKRNIVFKGRITRKRQFPLQKNYQTETWLAESFQNKGR